MRSSLQFGVWLRPAPIHASLVSLGVGAWIYAVLAFSLFRLVIIDVASPNARGGVLGGDPRYYETIASSLAAKISTEGWQHWNVRPDGQGVAGVAAVIYAVVGNHWFYVVALNAALHALSAVMLVLILLQMASGRAAFLAAIPFILSPYQMQWFSQLNKDSFNILGAFTFFAGTLFLVCGRRISVPLLLMVSGLALIWLNRPYAVIILTAGSVCCSVATIGLVWLRQPDPGTTRGQIMLRVSALAAVCVVSLLVIPVVEKYLGEQTSTQANPSTAYRAGSGETVAGLGVGCSHNENWRHITPAVEIPLCIMASQRLTFEFIRKDVNETTRMMTPDLDVKISSTWEALRYVPRAIALGFLAPFPSDWGFLFINTSSPFRNFVGMQMLVVYIGLVMLGHLLLTRPAPAMLIIVGACAFMIVVLGFSMPHIGSLDRYRYAYLSLLTAIGLSRAIDVFGPSLLRWFRKHRTPEASQ